jgi:hypothetical protein
VVSLVGVYVAGSGFGLVLSAAFFVALLAIGRHLRALRMAGQQASAAGNASQPHQKIDEIQRYTSA